LNLFQHPEFLELEVDEQQTTEEEKMKKKFEYKEVVVDGSLGMVRMENQSALNLLGEQGWEAVASYPGMTVMNNEPVSCRYVLFKREK
jgi:hypothetical protein